MADKYESVMLQINLKYFETGGPELSRAEKGLRHYVSPEAPRDWFVFGNSTISVWTMSIVFNVHRA